MVKNVKKSKLAKKNNQSAIGLSPFEHSTFLSNLSWISGFRVDQSFVRKPAAQKRYNNAFLFSSFHFRALQICEIIQGSPRHDDPAILLYFTQNMNVQKRTALLVRIIFCTRFGEWVSLFSDGVNGVYREDRAQPAAVVV